MTRGTASITADPSDSDGVVVRPVGRFDTPDFVAFKAACHSGGCVYEADDVTNRTFNRAPYSAIPHLIATLQSAQFNVALAPEIRETLSKKAAHAKALAADADARLARITKVLAERGERLWNYQGPGVQALAEHSPGGFALFDSPSLGKTVQALLALRDHAPTVVVTQASILGEWERAIHRWLPGRQVGYYEGRRSLRFWPKDDEVYLGSYGSVDAPELPIPPGLTVILDEAHNFSNPASQMVRRWNRLRDKVLAGGGTIWLLTGTPLMNNLKEFWTVLQLAKLGELAFLTRARFTQMATQDTRMFAERLKVVSLRRLKSEVRADLPPKVYHRVDAKITPADRHELDAALRRIVELAVQNAEQRALEEAALVAPGNHGLRDAMVEQAKLEARENVQDAIDLAFDGTIRVPFDLMVRVKSILALAKSRRSMELLDELEAREDSPILFFSAHLEPVRAAGGRAGWDTLTGEVTTKERPPIIDAFRDGKLRGLALTIRAGGTGLNLQRSHLVVRNDREWTPARNEQAADRAHRPGQTQNVEIFDVVADHVIDQRISDLLDEKQQLIDSTVEQAVTRLNEKRRSLADTLQDHLDNTSVATDGPPDRAWSPETDEEHALVAWAAQQKGAFFEGVTRRLRTSGKLTERVWEMFKRYGGAMQRQVDGDADRKRLWIKRSLRLLAGLDPPPAGIRIDGPTRGDAEHVRQFAERATTALPAEDIWTSPAVAALLEKYRRQIGDRP